MAPPDPELPAAAAAPPVVVINETRNLKTNPFLPTDDPLETGKAWEEWLEEIEREFRYFRITDAMDKKDALIIYGGKEIARLAKTLPEPANGNAYEKVRKKLDDYFTPMKNKHHARYILSKVRPNEGESTVAYAARVRQQANECEFGDQHDERILEHVIQTIDNEPLIQKAIHKKWNLTKFLEGAAEMEDTRIQIKAMKEPGPEGNVAKVQAKYGKYRPTDKFRRPKQHHRPQPCEYCGLTGIHETGQDCPAFGKRCHKCHRRNHFSSVCQAQAASSNTYHQKKQGMKKQGQDKKKQKKHVKKTRVETDSEPDESNDSTGSDCETSSDDEYFAQTVKHLQQVKKIKQQNVNDSKTLMVQIDDVDVRVEPDSGADVNIMDEHQFKALINRSNNHPTLAQSKTKLNTLQSELPVKGEFHTIVRNETCGVRTKFVVLKGRNNSPPLIC